VFAGANGIATITASLQGFSAQATLGVASFSPTARGFFQFPTSTSANDVDVEGRWAFVAAGDGGLYVIDVSKPDAPTLAGSLDTTGIAKDVVVSGNRAVLADGPAGLKVIDVTNPAAPLLTGGIATTDAQGIAVFGPRVFVADGSSGVRVIDVTDPVAPVLVATVDTPGTAKGVAVAPASNLLAVADGASGLQLIDLSDMNAPQLVGSVNTNGNARNVALRGDVALLADFTGALLAIDVSDRTAPRLSNTVPGNILTDLALGDRFAFGADVFRVNAVPIFDIRSPDDPIFRALIDFAQFRDDNGTGIDADSQFVYLTASLSLDDEGAAFGNTRLYIGQYRQARQDQGGVAPTVRITSPADGAEFVEGAPLSVEIEASDDVGVAGVALFLNGMPAGSDVTAPYSLGAAVPLDVSELEVLALAVDFGGNLARSAPVVLRVIEDPAPTVQIVTPATNTELVAGAKVRVTAEATDNTSVTEVVFSVDGQAVLTDTAAPYEFDLQVPAAAAGTALTVRAAARDTIGQVRTAVAIYPIVPDPLTTAQGIVLGPDSQPIAGVTLTANGGVTGVSGPDGSFSLSGISTILGDITVVGAALVGTQPLGGSTAPVPPVPGGITQVGTLLLRPELLIADFESGTLDGFEAAGLVAVFETILDQTAPDGRFMLGMSTAFFSVATAKTNTCLNAAGLNRLAFEYNFFTRDYAPFDDTFEVVVRSSLGERRTKVTSVVQEFGPAPPPEDFRTTGFRTASIDLSGLTPGETACSLEVELRIFDVGDTLVESFVLIDRLRFE
jgi:hypothetical protein